MPIYRLGDKSPIIDDSAYVAETATIIGETHLAANSSVWFGAVLRGDNDPIRIGAGTNIQDCSVLHTDTGAPVTIGCDVTVGHKAMLHGCTIGEQSLIGINAVILNHARIGKNCVIGANTLITEGKEIPDGSLVVGSPGRVVRQLTEEEIALIKLSAKVYMEHAIDYRNALIRMPDKK